jgi:hypothetical protein
MFQTSRVGYRCTDLVFERGGSLMTGVEANRIGAIVDLGTEDELRKRYGYDDTAARKIGFVSLRLVGEKLVSLNVTKEDRPQEKIDAVKEAATLFSDARSMASAQAVLGHVYLLRVVDTRNSRLEMVVKFMVIAHTPNESVTIRWQSLTLKDM